MIGNDLNGNKTELMSGVAGIIEWLFQRGNETDVLWKEQANTVDGGVEKSKSRMYKKMRIMNEE